MGSRFTFTEEAETQLVETLDHLAGEREAAAVRVRQAIYDAVGKLAERPGIGSDGGHSLRRIPLTTHIQCHRTARSMPPARKCW